jgi:hypothetical protein
METGKNNKPKPQAKANVETKVKRKPGARKTSHLEVNKDYTALTPQHQDSKNLHKIPKFHNNKFDMYEKTYDELAEKLNEYVEFEIEKDQVPNISGFCDFIKVSRATLYSIENGEVKKAGDELVQFIKDLRIYMENILATRMLSGDVNRSTLSSYIFSLKALAGWSETANLAIKNSIDIKIRFDD